MLAMLTQTVLYIQLAALPHQGTNNQPYDTLMSALLTVPIQSVASQPHLFVISPYIIQPSTLNQPSQPNRTAAFDDSVNILPSFDPLAVSGTLGHCDEAGTPLPFTMASDDEDEDDVRLIPSFSTQEPTGKPAEMADFLEMVNGKRSLITSCLPNQSGQAR